MTNFFSSRSNSRTGSKRSFVDKKPNKVGPDEDIESNEIKDETDKIYPTLNPTSLEDLSNERQSSNQTEDVSHLMSKV